MARERAELRAFPSTEADELTEIYVRRGLDMTLAREVARQLMAHDALGAHARDELGLTESLAARPLQAALASAASFAVGASFPLVLVAVLPVSGASRTIAVAVACVGALAGLGGLAAGAVGAQASVGALRVAAWGTLAMIVTAGVGRLVGTSL